MARTAQKRSNSLAELGYRITSATGKDSKGNEIVAKVTGPAPVYFMKMTKKGRLVAVKEKDAVVESTIEGLYDFKQIGDDIVGRRAGEPKAEAGTQGEATPVTTEQPTGTTQAA
jgi:hypothetical protein